MSSNLLELAVLRLAFAKSTSIESFSFELVRYADDFVCVVRCADDAERIEQALKNRFSRYGLEIHPTKSRKITFGHFERENAGKQNRKPNTFDFLGFTHYCDVSRKGKFKVGRKTSRKKFSAKCREMRNWLRAIRNQIKTKDWCRYRKRKINFLKKFLSPCNQENLCIH